MGYGVVLTPGPRGAADPTHVRAHNLSLVLREIHEHQPVSRTELATRTGLARASLTTLVPELVSYGLVRETDTRPRSGAGRPGTDLWIDGSATIVVIAELSRSGVIVETFDLAEISLRTTEEPCSPVHDGHESSIELISRHVRDHLAWAEQSGLMCIRVIVVVPGAVPGDGSGIVRLDELGWPELNFLEELESRLHSPDADLALAGATATAGLAEFWAYAKSDSETATAIFLTSEFGVRGAVISRSQLLTGGEQVGFEPAHVNVRPDGALCACGRRGCLVAEAGEAAIAQRAGVDLVDHKDTLSALLEVVRRDHEGDARSAACLDQLGSDLQRFIRDLQLLFDPDVIIIGGFWGHCFSRLGLGDTEMSASPATQRRAGSQTRLVVAGQLGADAARSGAIRATIRELFEDPAAIGERRLASLDRTRQSVDALAAPR